MHSTYDGSTFVWCCIINVEPPRARSVKVAMQVKTYRVSGASLRNYISLCEICPLCVYVLVLTSFVLVRRIVVLNQHVLRFRSFNKFV
jgi:hypothetical protein